MRVILQASSNREHELAYKNALTRLAQGIMENQDEKNVEVHLRSVAYQRAREMAI